MGKAYNVAVADKDPVIIIESASGDIFQDHLNYCLQRGYELVGAPTFIMVSCQDSWNGRQRSWTESKYSQMVKLKV